MIVWYLIIPLFNESQDKGGYSTTFCERGTDITWGTDATIAIHGPDTKYF